jgi:hypothetical protein
MRRILILLALAAVAPLALAAGPASAAEPEHEWLSVDETFTQSNCGFPIVQHDVVNLHFISWFDDSGSRTRQTVTAPGTRITWTNPQTGASVTSANPFVVHKTDNADGTTTIAFTGLDFAIPGGGHAYVSSGREVIVFSPSEGVEVLSSVGPSADLCEALAAAIG